VVTAKTDLAEHAFEDLEAASVHLEDLEIFVGQRSRMHPGPGWAVALAMVRQDLAEVRAEIALRSVAERFGARAG
jgi:hypothetical protein